MESIRTHDGPIRICASCAQPCYYGDLGATAGVQGWQHFREQWDGVQCPHFPLTGPTVAIEWDEAALATLKSWYRDTYPSRV